MLIPSAALTREEAKQVIDHVINYPLFVPDLGHEVTRALIHGQISDFLNHLKRLSQLGSRPAAATLAYIYMKDVAHGEANLHRAEAMCKEAATSGDPYAQYVMGWISRAAGRDAEAVDWLRKAASKGAFLPAFVDIARFMAGGVGVAEPDTQSALAVLWDAHKLGHRMALVYIAELLQKHQENWLKGILGTILYPIAIVRATRFTNRHPLSERIFVTSLSVGRPLFKISR